MESLYHYLYVQEPIFTQFNAHHVISLISLVPSFLLILTLYKLDLSDRIYTAIGSVLGFLVFINYPLWCVLELLSGSFDIEKHLPFHLCRISNLLILYVMIYRNVLIYNILFYWGVAAVAQAMFSPDIAQTFPHYHFIRYFISHHLFVISIIYATIIYKMRITRHGIIISVFALVLLLLFSFIANILVGGDANYLWIMDKPPESVKSLLDYLGPHPIYILSGLLVSIFIFYIIFYFDRMIRKKINLDKEY